MFTYVLRDVLSILDELNSQQKPKCVVIAKGYIYRSRLLRLKEVILRCYLH